MKKTESAPALSDEEQIAEYQRTGSRQLQEQIVKKYLYIPEIISRRYLNRGAEEDDLFQVACVGLLLAIERFDPGLGLKFSTFAVPTVAGEVKRYFRDRAFLIKAPRRLYDLYKKIINIKERAVTPEQMAEHLGVDAAKVLEVLKWERDMQLKPIDSDIAQDENPFAEIEMRDFIENSFESLEENEKTLLRLRYYKKKSQSEVARELKTTQMTVSRLERKVLQKLRFLYYK